MKLCRDCKLEKTYASFGKNSSQPDGLQPLCRGCRSLYLRSWYSSNKARSRAPIKRWRVKNTQAVREHLVSYLRDNPCVDCAEDNIIVLEFDHRDGVDKKFCIGESMRRGYSLDRVKLEVGKCDVRCANCHRKRTYKQRGFTHRS